MVVTVAQARASVISQVVDGPPNSITPPKLRTLLTDIIDAIIGSVPVSKLDATAAPTANDDISNTSGNGIFTVGSVWIDTAADIAYRCVDSSTGAAIWVTSTALSESVPQFATRAAFVTWAATNSMANGYVVEAGGLQYVAFSGATAISDLSGWLPSGNVYFDHFGAVGDGATNDTVAIQSAVNYLRTVAAASGPWYDDDRAVGGSGSDVDDDFYARTFLRGIDAHVYGMAAGVKFDIYNRGLVFGPAAFKAVGEGWSATNPMFSPSVSLGTYVTMDRVQINCDGKCSGILTQSFWQIASPKIRRMAVGGYGIETQGVKSEINNANIAEWTNQDLEFYNSANYGADGMRLSTDSRVNNGEVGWSNRCIVGKQDAVNIEVRNIHLFNGMGEYVDYNLDGTFVGGGTGTAVGRVNPTLIELEKPSNTALRTYFYGSHIYVDNGEIICRHSDVTFVDCHTNGNVNSSPASHTHWFTFYARQNNDVSRANLRLKTGVNSLDKKFVRFLTDSGTGDVWAEDTTSFEAHAMNLADTPEKTFELSAGGGQAYSTTEVVGELFSQSVKSALRVRDRASSGGFSEFGTAGNIAAIRSPAGAFRVVNLTDSGSVFDITATSHRATGSSVATAAQVRSKTVGKILTADILSTSLAEVTLENIGPVPVDFATGINFSLQFETFGRTLANPTNAVAGQNGYLRFVQDATGGRPLSFSSNYVFAGGTAPTIASAANAETVLFYTVLSSTRILIHSMQSAVA